MKVSIALAPVRVGILSFVRFALFLCLLAAIEATKAAPVVGLLAALYALSESVRVSVTRADSPEAL